MENLMLFGAKSRGSWALQRAKAGLAEYAQRAQGRDLSVGLELPGNYYTEHRLKAKRTIPIPLFGDISSYARSLGIETIPLDSYSLWQSQAALRIATDEQDGGSMLKDLKSTYRGLTRDFVIGAISPLSWPIIFAPSILAKFEYERTFLAGRIKEAEGIIERLAGADIDVDAELERRADEITDARVEHMKRRIWEKRPDIVLVMDRHARMLAPRAPAYTYSPI